VIASEPTRGREKGIYTITAQGKSVLSAHALEQRKKIKNILKLIDEVIALTEAD